MVNEFDTLRERLSSAEDASEQLLQQLHQLYDEREKMRAHIQHIEAKDVDLVLANQRMLQQVASLQRQNTEQAQQISEQARQITYVPKFPIAGISNGCISTDRANYLQLQREFDKLSLQFFDLQVTTKQSHNDSRQQAHHMTTSVPFNNSPNLSASSAASSPVTKRREKREKQQRHAESFATKIVPQPDPLPMTMAPQEPQTQPQVIDMHWSLRATPSTPPKASRKLAEDPLSLSTLSHASHALKSHSTASFLPHSPVKPSPTKAASFVVETLQQANKPSFRPLFLEQPQQTGMLLDDSRSMMLHGGGKTHPMFSMPSSDSVALAHMQVDVQAAAKHTRVIRRSADSLNQATAPSSVVTSTTTTTTVSQSTTSTRGSRNKRRAAQWVDSDEDTAESEVSSESEDESDQEDQGKRRRRGKGRGRVKKDQSEGRAFEQRECTWRPASERRARKQRKIAAKKRQQKAESDETMLTPNTSADEQDMSEVQILSM